MKTTNTISEADLKLYFQELLRKGDTITRNSLAIYYFDVKGKQHPDWPTNGNYKGYESAVDCFFGANDNYRKYFSRAIKYVVNELANNGIDIVCSKNQYKWPEDVPIEKLDNLTPKIEEEKKVIEILQEVDNLIPKSWLAKKLRDRIDATTISYMSFDTNMDLRNIQLMPSIIKAVKTKKVIRFEYKKDSITDPIMVIMHPHYIKEYNNRWFVFGYVNADTENPRCFAVDRISSEKMDIMDDISYIYSNVDYRTYFDDIVGVTLFRNSEKERITIRTLNVYVHELIATKPLHNSQVEVKPFDPEKSYGEFELNVKYNNELIGRLFMFESNIQVFTEKGSKIYKSMRYHIAKLAEIYGIKTGEK